MNKTIKAIIFFHLVGMLWGATIPGLLHGAETPGGNVWDQFVDKPPFPGITFVGPLSIYYEKLDVEPCSDGQPVANMYYTVRLSKDTERERHLQLYTFQGTNATCLGDVTMQGTEIRYFLETVVIPGIFGPKPIKSWKFKSIQKAQYNDDDFSRAFVADIEISVKR